MTLGDPEDTQSPAYSLYCWLISDHTAKLLDLFAFHSFHFPILQEITGLSLFMQI
jgi:hypothetical protein